MIGQKGQDCWGRVGRLKAFKKEQKKTDKLSLSYKYGIEIFFSHTATLSNSESFCIICPHLKSIAFDESSFYAFWLPPHYC